MVPEAVIGEHLAQVAWGLRWGGGVAVALVGSLLGVTSCSGAGE